MKLRARPCEEYPQRAKVTFYSGWATFNNAKDAREYLATEQSELVHLAARYYLEWLDQPAKLKEFY